MFTESAWLWVGFNAFVLVMLALDLGVFHRKAHAVSLKEATIWSLVWVVLALLFNALLYAWRGPQPALEFLTGYLVEKSLSVDKIFVFVLIFTSFGVLPASQHRVLFWGILGALVMRGVLILVGAVLLEEFHWIIYLFGAFLIFTGLKMAFHRDKDEQVSDNTLVRLVRRLLPMTETYEGSRFFVRRAGRLLATPLLLVLVIIESSDLAFAVDSIPAVFAVTRDPFIVYTSNVFAILGLRSLYFVLAGVIDKFYYLKLGLAAILTFVGAKMLLVEFYKVPTAMSLLVIASLLALAVLASWLRSRRLALSGQPQATEGRPQNLGEGA
jgi:tellurite resistance protein TerC